MVEKLALSLVNATR